MGVVSGEGGGAGINSYVSTLLGSNVTLALDGTQTELTFTHPPTDSHGSDITTSDGQTWTLANSGVYAMVVQWHTHVASSPDGAVELAFFPQTAGGSNDLWHAVLNDTNLGVQVVSAASLTATSDVWLETVWPASYITGGSTFTVEAGRRIATTGTVTLQSDSTLTCTRIL